MQGFDLESNSSDFEKPYKITLDKSLHSKIIKFNNNWKEKKFVFYNKPFGIQWNFNIKNEAIIVATVNGSEACYINLPFGLVLVKVNNSFPYRNPKKLKYQLKNIKLFSRLKFRIKGRRPLNYKEYSKTLLPWHKIPKIINIVAICHTGIKNINLIHVTKNFFNCEFEPFTKSVLIFMKLRNPLANIMMYSTGTINVTGICSELSALISCRKILRRLQKIGYKCDEFTSFQIKVVSGSGDIGASVNLKALFEKNPIHSCYDKELSSNCKFYFQVGKCEVTSRGKLNLLGLQTIDDFWRKVDEMYHLIHPHINLPFRNF